MRSEADQQRRWLTDILENIALAEEFTANIDGETLARDRMRLYATIRCLEIISEASRRVNDVLKSRHPQIDWQDMAASGNVYRHEYRAVATRVIWSTVKDYLPELRSAVEIEIRNLDGGAMLQADPSLHRTS